MNQLNRTIDACRDAGLPVVNERDCTCGLRGRLIVLARAAGLEVIWSYDRRCLTHDLRDPDAARRAAPPRRRRSRSWAAREASAGVALEHADALDLLPRHDQPDTVIYCDPPRPPPAPPGWSPAKATAMTTPRTSGPSWSTSSRPSSTHA